MKDIKRKILLILCFILLFGFSITSSAHSGRTDSSGGHHDYKNKSGLGSYHYHCGGHPPHLHENGVCPYAPKDNITVNNYNSTMHVGENQSFEYNIESASSYVYPSISSSDSSIVSVNGTNLNAKGIGTATITIKTNSAIKTFNITVEEIYADSIEISVPQNELQVDNTMVINSVISPSNTTNKNITYSSSDDNIATVSSTGEINGVSPGMVTITAETSNNISQSLDINIFSVLPEKIDCKDNVKLIVGDTYNLPIKILPQNSNNKEFTISVDNDKLLKFSKSTLRAIKEGETTLHIETWNGIKKDITVQIDIIPVENIEIKDTTKYILFNAIDLSDKISLEAEVNPKNATYQEVKWDSSNNDIISAAGNNFMIKGTGKVILTCTAHDGITNEVKIIVINKVHMIAIFLLSCIIVIMIIIFIRKNIKI